jgi:NAD-dependent DNA ligase
MTKTPVDENNQPLNRLYNCKRLNDRTIDELIGLAKGITADGNVNQAEAEFNLHWMTKNTAYCQDKIVNMLYARIRDMLSDKYLDRDEQQELLLLLKSISGDQCPAEFVEATTACFPLTKPAPSINFNGETFCLTGKFAYGPRRVCQEVIMERGGLIKSGISSQVDFLVIGSLCSSDWIHTTYGRKIETAMNNYANIAIVHEDHWAKHAFAE